MLHGSSSGLYEGKKKSPDHRWRTSQHVLSQDQKLNANLSAHVCTKKHHRINVH